MLPPRKIPSEQLSCFTFYLIRPLKASKSDYQKTSQFYPKTGSLFLTRFYVLIRAPYLNRPQREPTDSQEAASNVPVHHPTFINHPSILMHTHANPYVHAPSYGLHGSKFSSTIDMHIQAQS